MSLLQYVHVAFSFINLIFCPHCTIILPFGRAFIFNKRNKNKKGSGGGKKKSKWGKKKAKKSSKFASTELPVIEEEEQNREKDLEVIDTFFGNVYDDSKVSQRWPTPSH